MICPYEVLSDGSDFVLKVNCNNCPLSPSIEDNPDCMEQMINLLSQNQGVTKIILSQRRDYEYNETQVSMLKEISKVYRNLIRNRKDFEFLSSVINNDKRLSSLYIKFKKIVLEKIKEDPIGSYVELIRLRRQVSLIADEKSDEEQKELNKFINGISKAIKLLENTEIISLLKEELAGFKIGNRAIYSRIFYPTIKPDFMYSKLMSTYPVKGEVVESYFLPDETEVTIFSTPNSVLNLYHIIPPELKLSEEKYNLLDTARSILAEHTPNKEEFTDPKRVRDVFYNVGRDLIEEIAERQEIILNEQESDQLAKILVRYTIGFGLVEILLEDENIQDITINSPLGKNRIFLTHGLHEDCYTNIIPTTADAESWASKLRMISGRPLDEANPVLDAEIEIPYARARVAVVSPPLNPTGLAFAFRRHRDKPWTFPLFIKTRMMNPLAAGLLSFLIDGSRTFLIAGTRSSGKTSLLGSFMIEILRKFRIITVEDTLELPVNFLIEESYNVQQLKVLSALSRSNEGGVSASEGIRTTLRLGDSCLFVGEVRSTEAQSLYEAMRIGALANVVAGTIHGDSPYGVYDRVVNDLKIPKTSFKATDIIIVANPIRTPDGLKRVRRITQITEVRKKWDEDPLKEKAFVDLMKYDSSKDELVVTDNLKNGDSEILKAIGSNVKEWAGNWDAIWDNILLRAKIKEELVNHAKMLGNSDLLEGSFVIQANDAFHKISSSVKEELGSLDSNEIFSRWKSWLQNSTRNIKKSNRYSF